MAQVNIGAIKFNWKGPYNNGTTYAVDDVVSSGGSSYICILASTGNAVSNGTYWQIMSSAGTNGTDGTDVGATLANKEIAFKTNAGAVDGIPIGTAGQFLKVNSGATGYEYGAVSSDWVKISHVDSTTAVQVHNFQSVFNDSIYSAYQIMASCEMADNDDFRARFMSGSNVLSGSNDYRRIGYNTYRKVDQNGDALNSNNDGDGTNSINFVPWGFSNESATVHAVKLDIHGLLQSTSRYKSLLHAGTGRDNSNPDYFHINQGGHIYSNSGQSIDGISFYANNNNFQRFTGTVWGMKK